MAVTECHLGCTREEQLRWFLQNYLTVARLKSADVPVKAITAWAFLGSYDWDSLVTHENNLYEPGVYDISSGIPEPTALAELIKIINERKPFEKHLFEVPGWWKRDIRVSFLMKENRKKAQAEIDSSTLLTGKVIKCITDFSLQPFIAKILEQRGLACYFGNGLEATTNHTAKPWAVLNLEKVKKMVLEGSISGKPTKPKTSVNINLLQGNIPVATISDAICTSAGIHKALDLLIDYGGLKFHEKKSGVEKKNLPGKKVKYKF
jgi:hypothetical protein